MDKIYEEVVKRFLVENPANYVVYESMEIRDVVALKCKWEIGFISVDWEFVTTLINQGEK